MILKLTDQIYRLQIPFSNIYTCMFLICTPVGTVVYDTGTYASDISNYLVPALQELNMGTPCCVVVSHNHGDHAGGLAAFHELYPEATICAGSEACKERVDGEVQVLCDGMELCAVLKVVHIPGHTLDTLGIYDSRTKALISGDCLQAYGIYGKGKWGTSIAYPRAHLEALDRLENMDIQALYTAHHYEPCGNSAEGKEHVQNYILQCRKALKDIREYVRTHPETGLEELNEGYAAQTGLPIPPTKSFSPYIEQ